MKTWQLGVAVLLAAGAAIGQDRVRVPSVPEVARDGYDQAADRAEAAYRETVDGSFRVFLSRLVDAERARVRESRLDAANRIRKLADRYRRLAAEAARHVNLGGTLPPPGKAEADLGIGDAIAGSREEMEAARATYGDALHSARDAAGAALGPALSVAIRSADLDAANRVKETESAIARDVRDRLRRLSWIVVRFPSLESAEHHLVLTVPGAWRVDDGELVGEGRRGEVPIATLAPGFRFISAALVKARIRPPSHTNLRVGVGPVNAIFDWERAAQCHYRYYEDRTVVPGRLLAPGREYEIVVRQLTRQSVEIVVDGRRVWIHAGHLSGTVSVYGMESTIGIREICVLGIPTERYWPDGPSHRVW
jgi:hypothetical protein